MTQIKLWGLVTLALLLWPRRSSAAAPTGSVDIGEPTVSGPGSEQFGGRDYGTAPLVFLPDQSPFRIAEPTPLEDSPERDVTAME